MAVNQAKILEQLEQLVTSTARNEFIYGFLTAFQFPKATITQIRQGGTRNIAKIPGHVGLKNKLYYFPIEAGQDIDSAFDDKIADPTMAKNKIRYIVTTDFERFLAWDTATNERLDIDFEVLHLNYSFFLPLVGLEKAILNSEKPADVKAAVKMGKLFDLIRINNDLSSPEDIHALNVFLTRLLFCLFAEDTGIFKQKGQFSSTIKSCTAEDGSDLDQFLYDLFSVMNSPYGSELRQRLPKHLTDFPYVNGGLFESDEPIPELGKKGRRILLECGQEDWSAINPDIFGSMFQAVIDVDQRARLGQHYTSYSNIMKVIQPLFLDPLRSELEKQRNSVNGLKKLLVRLGKIKVFDPACGSGNFLIIAYKELRLLEIDVIQALMKLDQGFFISNIHLDQFYGIEIDDFACEIARLSLWLAEHQINKQWEVHIGPAEPSLPLKATGKIVSENSLNLDWNDVCPKSHEDEVYVIGNPPFLGTLGRSDIQRQEMKQVFSGFNSLGNLDYVACWFWKGSNYIANSKAELALVATNSLCQGEQVSQLWPSIFELGLSIHFAYPTFPWANNARDKAAVHVIIVGLSANAKAKCLYQNVCGEWHSLSVKNISPYLVEGSDIAVYPVSKPLIKGVPPILFGNKPTDGGNLLLDRSEYDQLMEREPSAKKWIKRVLGADEFLNSKERWCLWLVGASNEDIARMPLVHERVKAVETFRINSSKEATRKKSSTPHLFDENRHPTSGNYIVIPRVSSQLRRYIPIGFYDHNVISTDRNFILPSGTLYEFAILMSLIHNEWMRLVAMRLKSDYSYGNKVVYNTFPWPSPNEQQRQNLVQLAENILLAREDYPGKTLAELYNPDSMPDDLKNAHAELDNAVDKLYRDKPFRDTADRLSFLLARYEAMVAKQEE
ncbi:N-6 DNA methylase [Vibrio parahaemolyticus]|uniref:class I SAM-dependent DNA methyltransferase n=1 Tax=Vibrio parahaemolyticus TaxID=670 RepID=UPI001E05E9C0|nr:DNA methyltransferase [Vibrio parahaemolyticus]EGQ8049290.1 class I SAM-dependent DNA methyltransferase [Vibrio parahaemolyticus]EGQ9655172.1 class I SAM-dependent DNA methyltransferase [Vibrio parahaemolyticus]EGR0251083.1 class I SAM-dependent DNA methyltransferase [Vibrio parahaemolyticus]EGR0280465.1 class I SAM-dependent DNA methyltransferase [Vibrio parahaemolyticus]EGR1454241.1 class I SAM-dependent DNA methyltransferase [Vibrio parahaemolyticus]